MTPDISKIESIENLAALMDSRFSVPGINLNIGLDTLIGLVPGIGDTIGMGVSGYIIVQSKRLGVPKRAIGKMVMNSGIDWVIGTIPLIGDLFDWGWKANNKNAAILRNHYHRVHGPITIIQDDEVI